MWPFFLNCSLPFCLIKLIFTSFFCSLFCGIQIIENTHSNLLLNLLYLKLHISNDNGTVAPQIYCNPVLIWNYGLLFVSKRWRIPSTNNHIIEWTVSDSEQKKLSKHSLVAAAAAAAALQSIRRVCYTYIYMKLEQNQSQRP